MLAIGMFVLDWMSVFGWFIEAELQDFSGGFDLSTMMIQIASIVGELIMMIIASKKRIKTINQNSQEKNIFAL